MAFEKFIPPQTSGVRPRATIRPSGLISFDAATVETFGLDTASYAVLYFDKTRKMVGVQITKNEGDDGALKLSRRRRSVSLKAPHFFDLYGLSFEEAQRFDVGHDPEVVYRLDTISNFDGALEDEDESGNEVSDDGLEAET